MTAVVIVSACVKNDRRFNRESGTEEEQGSGGRRKGGVAQVKRRGEEKRVKAGGRVSCYAAFSSMSFALTSFTSSHLALKALATEHAETQVTVHQ